MTSQSPAQIAEKWSQRLSASTQQIQDGVNAVTVAPGQTAAARADLWLARVTASKDKWRTNVGRVSLEDWKRAMLDVGLSRVSQGAQANQPKVEQFMAKFMPYLKSGVDRVQAMPKVTLQDSINRAVQMIQHNAAYRG